MTSHNAEYNSYGNPSNPGFLLVAHARNAPVIGGSVAGEPGSLQQPRGPSDTGHTVTHTSWWHGLRASYIHMPQPSPPPWGSCWQSIWGRGLAHESIWVLWRLGHAAVPCGALQRYLAIQACRQDLPAGRCMQPGCEEHWDTLTHGFLECPVVQRVWQWVADLWAAVSMQNGPPLTLEVLLCGRMRPVWQPRSLWHLFRGVAVGCIFQARARALQSGQPLSSARVACCIVSALRTAMQRDWLAATRCSSVRALFGVPAASPACLRSSFHRRWRPCGPLCSVAGTILTVRLTPSYPIPVPTGP